MFLPSEPWPLTADAILIADQVLEGLRTVATTVIVLLADHVHGLLPWREMCSSPLCPNERQVDLVLEVFHDVVYHLGFVTQREVKFLFVVQ